MKRTQLTWEEREKIFAKEALKGGDSQLLMGCSASTASGVIKRIKTKYDRLQLQGVVHIQDYIDFFNLTIDRYAMPRKKRPYEYDVDKVEQDNIVEVLGAVLKLLSPQQIGLAMQKAKGLDS